MISKDRQEIYKTIWSLANDLRGSVDGWEFKNYVLGFMFYRYISEHFAEHINRVQHNSGDLNFNYHNEKDRDEFWNEHKRELVEEKGYFIYPSQLFKNVLERFEESRDRANINKEIKDIFDEIERSSKNNLFRGLFKQMDFGDDKLGQSGRVKGEKILDLLKTIQKMNLRYEDVSKRKIDLFGDAYEYLIGMYASNAGKSGGEYYTPPEVSETLVKLVCLNRERIRRVYDPACGSGSLLLKFLKEKKSREASFYGQEINLTTYNLCRMNMFLHNVPYHKFHMKCGDTLLDDKFKGTDICFDAVVSNPPYSVKWEGEDNPKLIIDERFIKAGVLAPKSKGDLAFIMHSLHYLEKNDGVAAIVCFPGIFYRGGKEKKIREYLVNQNFVDGIIQLPENLFYGTSIETCILVLKKNKRDGGVFFLDASEKFEKIKNRNRLKEENIKWIVDSYAKRRNVEGYSRVVEKGEIEEKDYNLSINAYVRRRVEKTEIDIEALNEEIREGTKRIGKLREEIEELLKSFCI